MILLDTHAALWFTTDDPNLGPLSRSLVVEALASARLAVSAISFREISLLITKGRLRTSETPAQIRSAMFEAGILEVPLTGDICLLAVALPGLHSDPADRFIAATAIAHDAALMTIDAGLLRWPHAMQRHNASR